MTLGENSKPLYSKGKHKQNEKTVFRMSENISKLCEQRGLQFSSVAQSCPALCDPMNCSMPGLPVHRQLLEFTQTHVHGLSDVIQPSHPLSPPSPLALNLSQHQGFLQ